MLGAGRRDKATAARDRARSQPAPVLVTPCSDATGKHRQNILFGIKSPISGLPQLADQNGL